MTKVIMITGSYSGIGRATAEFFSDEGWEVVATMRHPEERDTRLKGREHVDLVHLDVTEPDSIREAVRLTVEKYGHIDVLVNNAGYAVEGVFESSTLEQARKQFDTNVLGLMAVTREVLPVMRRQKGGVIVNVSSIGGKVAFPMYTLYNSTKFAVEGFSEGLQYELRPHNIKVVLIEPGVIRTDFYDRSMVVTNNGTLTDYDEFVGSATRGVKKTSSAGSVPEIVAMCIHRAATDGKWKLRYHAGKYSGLILTLRKILPDRALFGIVKRSSLPKK